MSDEETQEPTNEAIIRVSQSREKFEGREDYFDVRRRLKHRWSRQSTENEASLFLQKMREYGDGKIAIAWRNHFDSDGDTELDFKEFCAGLASVKYRGNTGELWRQLSGNGSGLKLQDLDPEHASYLEAFSTWCAQSRGGPAEVFREIDHDGSNSVKKHEFLSGLQAMGIFADRSLPEGLRTQELLSKNLYPLLATGNCVNIDDLLFLEKDQEKRQRIVLELQRIRDFGVQAGPGPLPNEGQRLLFRLSMSTTQLGGKHWKGVKDKMARGVGAMPYSPNFRPNTTWLEQIALNRVHVDRLRSASLPKLKRSAKGVRSKKLMKPLGPPVNVAHEVSLPLLTSGTKAWDQQVKESPCRCWPTWPFEEPSFETSMELDRRRLAFISLSAGIFEASQSLPALVLQTYQSWILQLSSSELLPLPALFLLVSPSVPVLSLDPLYLPSLSTSTLLSMGLPWDPASFVAELQPQRREALWDREDITHGRVVLMAANTFCIDFLYEVDDLESAEELLSLKPSGRRSYHSFPTKVKGRRYFPIPPAMRVRL